MLENKMTIIDLLTKLYMSGYNRTIDKKQRDRMDKGEDIIFQTLHDIKACILEGIEKLKKEEQEIVRVEDKNGIFNTTHIRTNERMVIYHRALTDLTKVIEDLFK